MYIIGGKGIRISVVLLLGMVLGSYFTLEQATLLHLTRPLVLAPGLSYPRRTGRVTRKMLLQFYTQVHQRMSTVLEYVYNVTVCSSLKT